MMSEGILIAVIGAIPATLTFLLTAWVVFKARNIPTRVDEIHTKQEELVLHTNSLTDKLMEKTDAAARSEGVKEGIAKGMAATVDTQASALAAEAAQAAAKIIRVAADKAAELLADAAKSARAQDRGKSP